MASRTRPTPLRGRMRKPQAIRRPAGRFSRHQLLDAIVLVLIALGLLYLANPARASELPAEDPVELTEAASGDGLSAGEVSHAAASSVAALELAPPGSVQTQINPAAASAWPQPGSQHPSLYELAASRYELSPRLLRALHLVESSGAPDGCLANREGSGATGPFQFKPATFRAYGIDADGDGRPNICGFVDSLFSAARYLRALGANGDASSPATRRALRRYGTDPALVARLAG